MSLSITELNKNTINETFFDPHFRWVLEAHMSWLRTLPTTMIVAIQPHDAYKYEGDFYGLLEAQGISKNYHWVILRLNGLTNPGDVNEDTVTILVPDFQIIERLRQMHTTRVKKTGSPTT